MLFWKIQWRLRFDKNLVARQTSSVRCKSICIHETWNFLPLIQSNTLRVYAFWNAWYYFKLERFWVLYCYRDGNKVLFAYCETTLSSWTSKGICFFQVALIVFSTLTETIGDFLKPHFTTLQAIFMKGLQDPQSCKVRMAALKYVSLLQWKYPMSMFAKIIVSVSFNFAGRSVLL